MEKFENISIENNQQLEEMEELHGVEYLHNGIPEETLDELDHILSDDGYSISTIEDAFEYSDEADRLEQELKNFTDAINADQKEKAYINIVNLIK